MANGQIPQAKFLSQLRSKYPSYAEIPDSTLLDKILTKYPEYKNQIVFDSSTELTQEEAFDTSGDGYDYDTANQYGLEPDSAGKWPSREPNTGRILKAENHETFNETLVGERELGNVVYRGDDGSIYSHPENSVNVSPDNILSSEIASPNSSSTNLNKAAKGVDTSKKEIHSNDYGIPQINDSTWENAFKEEYKTSLKEGLPEQHLEFAINRILLNSKGDSPAGIQNWTAYMNGSWAKYKDFTDEDYIAVMGADPRYLATIDSLAGAEASTVKAVFAAESDFNPTAVKTNYLSSTASPQDETEPTLDLPNAGVVLDKNRKEPTISQAPEPTFLERTASRLANAWKYRDLTFKDPSQAEVAGRAQADYLALERLKELSKTQGVFKHPNSPEWEQEVKEMVAWNVMSEPESGQQDTALGRGLQAAQKDAYNRKVLSGSPRERYKKALAGFDIETGPGFANDNDFLSLSWSNSLSGIAWKLASGNEVDLTFYEPSEREQMAAGIVGLMMPLDALSFGVGGIIGKGGMSVAKVTDLTKKTLTATSGRLAKQRLIKNGVSEVAANRAVQIAVNKTANRMASFGGALGTYEGLGSALTQYDEKGFIDPVTWTKDVVAHTVLGMVTGTLAELGAAAPRIVKPLAKGKGAKLTQEGLGFVGEVGGFGGFSPLLVEGRKPIFPDDFVEAGTFLLGIKLASPLQQVYGQATSTLVQKSVAFRIRKEYSKGKSFEEAQRIVHNELKSAVELAIEREGLVSEGSAVGMSSGGKGHILGEKPNIPIDKNGVGIILDANGTRIPYRPLSTQKELVTTGEIKKSQLDADGNLVMGADGQPVYRTISLGRGQVPEKAEKETTVPGEVVDTRKVTEPVLDKEGRPVLDKEGKEVTREVTEPIREEVPISEAVAREFELPAYLKKDALQSAPESALRGMLKDKNISERESRTIRVELERRKLIAPKGEDVSDLVQQRGNMQAEQNRLFQELQALKEGTAEYDAKEKQIVEMGGKIETLDSQIAGKAVPVESPVKGERVVGREGQKQLPGEAEVPLGKAGEGGVVKVAVGGAKGREPEISPEQAKAADLISRGEAPVVEPAKKPTPSKAKAEEAPPSEIDFKVGDTVKINNASRVIVREITEESIIGESIKTGDRQAYTLNNTFEKVSGVSEAPKPKTPTKPKFEDITGSKGNKLGEINLQQEGGSFGNYGIRKDVKDGKEIYKVVIKRADTGLKAQVQTIEGEFFGSYKEAFDKLADRIARDVGTAIDKNEFSKELQDAVLQIEKTFDNKILRNNTESDLVALPKSNLIELLNNTIHIGGYKSFNSLTKPQIASELKKWQGQGDAARSKLGEKIDLASGRILEEAPIKKLERDANDTKPINEKLAKAKLSGNLEKAEIIEKAGRGEVREDAPKSIQEMVLQKAEVENKIAAEFKKGEKADENKLRDLAMDKAELAELINNAKLGKPRDGDQVTMTPTAKVTKGKKKVARKPTPDNTGKLELQNIFGSIREQVEAQIVAAKAEGSFEIDYSKIIAPEHSRIDYNKYKLKIELPQVNGEYSVSVPSSIVVRDGKINTRDSGGEFFSNFSKAKINKAFAEYKVTPPRGGRTQPLTSENAPIFTAPNRQSLAKSDIKGLENALKGYEARLKKYSTLSSPDVERSAGQLKEAIRIAKDLIKTQKEADRLGGTIAGVDFIPGTTALFNAMRNWKRSKLPVSDRQKYDNLAKRSNKLYNEWVAGGKVDREMEGRLEKLSTEMTRLENSIKNQIPTEQEIVKVAEDIAWPTRTADLRRTHQKQRDLTERMEENVELGADRSGTLPDPNFRDLKLQVTKGRSDSQKDFTQEEVVAYEQILNEMIRTGGYLSEAPATRSDSKEPNRLIDEFSFLPDKLTRFRNMGNAGNELADLSFRFVRNQTSITGKGEDAVIKITKLIGKKNLKYFVAAIDPYLAKGMDFKGLKGSKKAFLKNPKTIKAVKTWKEYTDYLHKLRGDYDTYVEFRVDGVKKFVEAKDVYLDNWIRYQLKEDVAKEFATMGKGFYKEVDRLLAKGDAKTIEEAQSIIGEWTRTSPFYQGPVRYGSADRLRLQQLSSDSYETDFAILAPAITRKYATFLAGAEAFGQDMSVRKRVIGQIHTESGPRKAKEAESLLERVIDGESETSPRFFNFLARNFSAAQLTSPRSGNNNIWYSFTTDIPTYGFRNVGKGIFGFLKNPAAAIELTRRSGQLGVGTREIKSVTFDKQAAEFMTGIGLMKTSEYVNRAKSVISAGATAQTYIDYMSGKMSAEHISFFGKSKLETGRIFFREFGGFTNKEIDAMVKRGYLTEKEMEGIQAIVPSITQGSTHPLFMNDLMSGKMEAAGALYKMAYRSTIGLYKSVYKPLAVGNPAPLMRWAAGTAIAGEFQYFLNYALFGWEHPSEGSFEDFINYLHGESANTEKFKAAGGRLARNMLRAQAFGILSDTVQGYGMVPIAYDASKKTMTELIYMLTGKKTMSDGIEDFSTANIAIVRDWYKLKQARFSQRSKEFRRYGNVNAYIRNYKGEKTGGNYGLSDNSSSIRAVKEAYWIADKDEMLKVMKVAAKTITQANVEADMSNERFEKKRSLLQKQHRKDANDKIKNIVKGMHPLDKLSGELRVEVGGRMRLLKSGSKNKTEATNFWDSLNPREKEKVVEAVDNHITIIKDLNLTSFYE